MTTPAVSLSAAPDAQPSPQPGGDAAQPQPDEQEQWEPGTDAADTDEADDTDDEDDADDDEGQDDRGSNASRQAARYRVQLREAQDQNVTLAAALGLQQQAIVDMLVTSAGFDAKFSKLIESSGVELDDLLDDGGLVDPGKVRQAIVSTARAFNVQPNRRPKPVSGQGQTGGSGGSGKGWSDLLSEAAGRGRG